MNTTTYALPKNSQAWHDALFKVAHLLSDVHHTMLKDLPIFAITVVVNRSVLSSENSGIELLDEAMNRYMVNLSKWHLQMVYDDEAAKQAADKIVAGMTLADVVVSRYLLLPNDPEQMTKSKQEAAARIIDEQLTHHLKQCFSSDDGKDAVDVHILNINQILTAPKLVCFDMDSTLIEQEVIVELARMCGLADKVSEITESAMRGEINFAESFAKRVALLENVPESVVGEIIQKHITIQPGAFAVIRALKTLGATTVLVSGGFEPFAQHVAQTLGMDEFHANPLLVADGKLTGLTDSNILDGKQKALIVERTANRMGISLAEVVCVGDGANDLPMMAVSGTGIAYKAKPIVAAKADAAVNITGLEGVLYALGHRFDKV